MSNIDKDNSDLIENIKLAELVRVLNSKGHNPATSGNYSTRSKIYQNGIWISESGIDKSLFTGKNFLLVDQDSGNFLGEYQNSGRKASDETAIHLAIYRSSLAQCVLHSHILESILFAEIYSGSEVINIRGLELLKGFKGIQSHEEEIKIPCFQNSQDISNLAKNIEKQLAQVRAFGFILRGHGIYVWGDSVSEAKRHLEVFEYIFKYHFLAKQAGIL